jgi:hypothetical protein
MLTSLAVAIPLPQEPSTQMAEIKVPDGTEIEVQLKNNASGEDLKVGDIVDFTVLRPVLVNGVTVFEKDASARARITTAKRAGHWGHAGKLEWAMQDVQAADGTRVPARFTKRSTGDSKGGTVAVAAVATTVLLGPLGLLWGLKKGKPAIIPAGNRYSAFVSGDTKLDQAKLLNTTADSRQATTQEQASIISNSSEGSSIIVNSTPAGADIKIDGKFIGSTPSTVKLAAGEHNVVVEKAGFQLWQRTLSVSDHGSITVEATLEKVP